MKKALVVFCILAFFALLAQSPAQAQTTFGFKVTGGMAYVGGGDMNKGAQGWSDAWHAIFTGVGASAAGGYSPVHLGMDLGGEFLVQFNPSLALGLGAGYLQASKSSSMTLTAGSSSAEDTWAPKISAIPITATLYYYLPSAGGIKFFLDAGVGYYLGKYQDSWQVVFLGTVQESYDMTANGIGFHGGLGLEVPLSPMISLLVEARGRYAELGGFNGTFKSGTSTTTGDAWIEPTDALGFGTFPLLTVNSSTPSTAGAYKAKLGFSGFSAVLGFLFHF